MSLAFLAPLKEHYNSGDADVLRRVRKELENTKDIMVHNIGVPNPTTPITLAHQMSGCA